MEHVELEEEKTDAQSSSTGSSARSNCWCQRGGLKEVEKDKETGTSARSTKLIGMGSSSKRSCWCQRGVENEVEDLETSDCIKSSKKLRNNAWWNLRHGSEVKEKETKAGTSARSARGCSESGTHDLWQRNGIHEEGNDGEDQEEGEESNEGEMRQQHQNGEGKEEEGSGKGRSSKSRRKVLHRKKAKAGTPEEIPYWEERVVEQKEELQKLREEGALEWASTSAFVAFRSRRVAAVAAQTIHSMTGSQWRLHPAPQPDDVLWGNVQLRLWQRWMRGQLGTLLTVLIVIFFYVPVTAVAGLTSVQELIKLFPFLKTMLESNRWLHSFLSSFLPSLALRVMLWVVPPLLMVLARMEGLAGKTEVQRAAATRHFFVLLFNVFLGYTFTSNLFTQLQAIIDHPQDMVTILATSVPQTASFFIEYVVVSGVLFFLELLRFPIPFFRYLFLRWWTGKLVADREKLWDEGGILYHVFIPYQNLVITFGMVYAVIAPLILPFVLLYSLIGYVVWKHQVLYVYMHRLQTGGLMWPQFVDHVFLALMLAQLTAIGEFGLKQAFAQAGWAVPLPIITAYFWSTLNAHYGSSFKVLPLELACIVDAEIDEQGEGGITAEAVARKYVPSCLRKEEDKDEDEGVDALLVEEAQQSRLAAVRQSSPNGAAVDLKEIVMATNSYVAPPIPQGNERGLHGNKGSLHMDSSSDMKLPGIVATGDDASSCLQGGQGGALTRRASSSTSDTGRSARGEAPSEEPQLSPRAPDASGMETTWRGSKGQ
eukprot:TRINITY_DN11596_c0_g1_i1.p1 TRINITY_DN11596_c0_g1~~TRINITY_DN11596_c0_g1_i1.p1  ORF type:complete len:792 (-),score=185.91 TRINITY_DN11596_c0_g1_i1:440-2740(-)